MATPALIYCGGGARRYTQIALSYGFKLGARLPSPVHGALYFADQDWKRPDRGRYMQALAMHRPQLATVLDWEHEEQLSEVLEWAEEATQYCRRVIIIPKVVDLAGLPRQIGGAEIVLGYSVPTRYGGSSLPLWEIVGWPVHLLGGSPHRQLMYYSYLSCQNEIISVDGNMTMLMANRYARYWRDQKGPNGHWWQLNDGRNDAPYEAFRRSCEAIIATWRSVGQAEALAAAREAEEREP